jgi:hypothetical protein
MYRELRGRDEAFAFEYLLLTAECRLDEAADQCWRYVEEGCLDVPLLLEALTRGYSSAVTYMKLLICPPTPVGSAGVLSTRTLGRAGSRTSG